MSLLRLSKVREFGGACERMWDHWTGSRNHSVRARKPRRLMIDALEQRMLLSVSPVNVNDMLVNQALITPPLTTTANSGSLAPTIPWYMDAAANFGRSVAVDNNGDFVVTWQSVDPVGVNDPATGKELTDSNIYARYFTNAIQRIDLPADATSIVLQYNGNAVEKLSFSTGTALFCSAAIPSSGPLTSVTRTPTAVRTRQPGSTTVSSIQSTPTPRVSRLLCEAWERPN